MKRTIEYLKNLREDVAHSIEDEYSTSTTVDSNDLKHINEALEDIENLQAKYERLELNRTHALQYTHDEVLNGNLSIKVSEYIHDLLTNK